MRRRRTKDENEEDEAILLGEAQKEPYSQSPVISIILTI